MLCVRGRAARLGPYESAIIEDFAAHPGRIRTPEDLAAAIYKDRKPEDWPVDYLYLIEHRMVTVRKMLPPRFISTVYERAGHRMFSLHAGRNRMIGWQLVGTIKIEQFNRGD